MSVEATDAPTRVEGISTSLVEMPQPAEHGGAGQFVINDAGLQPADLGPADRNFPDGSLYQQARAAWYEAEQYDDVAILSRSYTPAWTDTGQEFAVTLTSSRWKAGEGTGDDYRPHYKYDLTLRPLDENGDADLDRTPMYSLNLKLIPQRAGMRYPDGEPLELPYNQGTLVKVQTTYVSQPEQLRDRAADVIEHVFDEYEFDADLIHRDSTRFWKAEAHHRFVAEKEADVVHTVRQSQDLIPHHGGDVETSGHANGGDWLKVKMTTTDWHLLGHPRLDVPILVKVYYPDNPERVSYPMDQPKIEAALAGNPNDTKLHWDRWDEIMDALHGIVLSHLHDAGVSPADLVADDVSDGAQQPRHEFALPTDRKDWLRDHYESLVPALYREAQRERTMLTYDILSVLARRGTATYDLLEEETGAARRTIREHVRRLEEDVGGDGPGLVERVQSVQTHIVWAEEMRQRAEEALAKVHPDDTPDDLDERADERREEREQRDDDRDQEESGDDRDDDGRDDEPTETWATFDRLGLTGEQLGRALEQEFVEHDHVEIRTDQYDWLGSPT